MPILDDYDYDLPERLIAQHPAGERDGSRLLVVGGNASAHMTFRDLPGCLDPGDLLVVNDTRVFPARLIGHKKETGGEVEIFLLHPTGDGSWEALSRPAKRLREGTVVVFDGGLLRAVVEGRGTSGHLMVRLESDGMWTRRWTVWAKSRFHITSAANRRRGTLNVIRRCTPATAEPAAAPTAGLHFTDGMLASLAARGIKNVP